MSTREEQRTERRRMSHATVTEVLSRALPGVDGDIAAVLKKARADKGMALGELADHLYEHHDALTSGDPRCPAALIRLTHVLHDAGHVSVVRPGCAGCGKITIDLGRVGPAGRICQSCVIRANLATCARCGRTGTRLAARRPEGGICYPCYRFDAAVIEECGRCGRTRMPAARLGDGTPLCIGCWTPPAHQCTVCGQVRRAGMHGPDGVICRDCYWRSRPRRACGRCGRVRAISKRANGEEPDLCYGCNRGPEMICSGCGRLRPSRRHGDDAIWLCQACKPRTIADCSGCGRSKPVQVRWPMGPLCSACHVRILDTPGECADCGLIRVLVARNQDGSAICGPCAGVRLDPRCATCGRPGRHYSLNMCAHCVLDERLRQLLTGPDGEVLPQLESVLRAFASTQRPRALIYWLTHSPNSKLLAQLAAVGRPISHEMLDEIPPGRHEYYVRRLLVTTGVLPERHDDLERLPAWLDKTLADKPAEHARLIRPFTHWFLLRRARRRATRRRQPAIAGSYLRTRITTALQLLTWLDQHGRSLAELDQPSLEAWLANGNTSSYTIRYFLDWAAAQGITQHLTVPLLPMQNPEQFLDEQQRWDLLRRCLTDDSMPLDIRAAAALVLLFGLPVSRIRHLTADQLVVSNGRTTLHTGRHPLPLPPRLAELLQRLARTPHTRARLTGTETAQRWLFPGLTPGRPTSQSGFRLKLRSYGIEARPARNAALIALAGTLPTAVLADILGMSTGTAERWAALAKRDWTAYIAERHSQMRVQ